MSEEWKNLYEILSQAHGLQARIDTLTQELREARERIEFLEGENAMLKVGADPGPELSTITTT